MISLTVLTILLIQSSSYDLSYEEFLASTPNSFGLLTVTHARNGSFAYFEKHLKRYAEMDCPEMTEIAVAWNNEVNPEEVGFNELQKKTWKRPVYFIKTPYNSMDFRYMLNEKSKAQIYFSMDDDVVTTCKELKKTFVRWQKQAIGDVGPIMSYESRSYDFNAKKNKFKYLMEKYLKTYFLTLSGVAWIPRIYLELYYSSRDEVQKMRNIIRKVNNCDDILMNYVVNYYFPEFISRAIEYALKLEHYPSSQSTSSTHKQIREECMNRFSEILGFNPIRAVTKDNVTNANSYLHELNKQIIYMRRVWVGQLLEYEKQNSMKQKSLLGNFSLEEFYREKKQAEGEEFQEFNFTNPWIKQLSEKCNNTVTTEESDQNEELEKMKSSIDDETIAKKENPPVNSNLKKEKEKLEKENVFLHHQLEEKDREITSMFAELSQKGSKDKELSQGHGTDESEEVGDEANGWQMSKVGEVGQMERVEREEFVAEQKVTELEGKILKYQVILFVMFSFLFVGAAAAVCYKFIYKKSVSFEQIKEANDNELVPT